MSNYKLMVHAAGSQITSLKDAIGTYPDIDGLVAVVQTNTQKADLQTIVAARPELRVWRYLSVLEYPFSIAAGQSENEVWNAVRGELQFGSNDVGAGTRNRMIVAGEPSTVGCFDGVCNAPTDEFYELMHWTTIGSSESDSFVTTLLDLADDISSGCAWFLDQAYLRIFSWMVDNSPPVSGCGAVTFQSGHGATCGVGNYGAATYANLSSAFGALNWRVFYNAITYFFSALDGAIPDGSWNLRNGDFRRDHTDNYDSGLGTYRNLPNPMFIENPHGNNFLSGASEAEKFASAMPLWLEDERSVLGIFSPDTAQHIEDVKTAWRAKGGGWISLLSAGLATPPTDSTITDALDELITYRARLGASRGAPPSAGAKRKSHRLPGPWRASQRRSRRV